MSISHRYPDFGKAALDAQLDAAPADEEVVLESFDKGYQAGWDDAAAAHISEQATATREISQRLQELNFTYNEAYSKLALSIKPLMTKFVTTLLPEAARVALSAQIMAELDLLLKEHGTGALEVAVAPDRLEQVQEMLGKELDLPFTAVAEPTLSAGQIYLRVGAQERHINLDAVLSAVTDAVEAFFDSAEKEVDHG